MKRATPGLVLLVLLLAYVVLVLGERQTVAEGCKFALVPQSTCKQTDTGKCPEDCRGEGGAQNGNQYTQNDVFTTVEVTPPNGGRSDGTENKDCYVAITCNQDEDPGKICDVDPDDIFGEYYACRDVEFNEETDGCTTYSNSTPNMVPAPSAKVAPCD